MSAWKAAREWMAQSTLAHVAVGFLAMGAWAVFANRHHALPQALLSGLVQGTISGLLTLVLKKFLEWFSARLANFGARTSSSAARRSRALLSALIVPPLITAASILIILVAAHRLAGTPEILATIAVPFTVSTSYAILYNLRLWRAAHGR